MLLDPENPSLALTSPAAKRSWLVAGLWLAGVTIALCALFQREVEGAYRVWLDSTAYNHCFLVLPVAAYLAWRRRAAFSTLSPQPNLWFLMLMVPLTLAWLLAAVLSVLEAQQLIVVAMFQCAALAILGLAAYRALLTPLLYLFFLVPTGYFLVPWLQDFTARFILVGLHLMHIPVYSDGTLIEVPAGSFVVAEACAGLRFLIASVAFGVLFASVMYKSRIRWIAFIALSIVVPIIANGMRALGIIVIAEITGNANAVMADHIIYGWGFFSVVTILLMFAGMSFADREDSDDAAPAGTDLPIGAPPQWRMAAGAVLGLALAALGPGYSAARDWQAATVRLAQAPGPPVAGSWEHQGAGETYWKPIVIDPDREYLDLYADGRDRVIRYVALYAMTGIHNNLVRSQNGLVDTVHWHIGTQRLAHVTIHGQPVTLDAAEIADGLHRLLVWQFYVIDGRIVADKLDAKLAQFRDVFGSTHSVGAYVAVATEMNGVEASPDRVLARFLDDMAPMADYLHGLSSP